MGDCLKLFDKLSDPKAYLKNHVTKGVGDAKGEPFQGGDATAATTRIYADPNTGQRVAVGQTVFNENSWFFTGKRGGMDVQKLLTMKYREKNGFGNRNMEQIRELMVIHEMMHVNDTAGTYDDKGKPINKPLNDLIRAKCF